MQQTLVGNCALLTAAQQPPEAALRGGGLQTGSAAGAMFTFRVSVGDFALRPDVLGYELEITVGDCPLQTL